MPTTDVTQLADAFESDASHEWPVEAGARGWIEACINAGLIREVSSEMVAYCPDCVTYHPVRRCGDGKLFAKCGAGRRCVDPEQMRRWKADPAGLKQYLTGALDIESPSRELLTGALWVLGQAPGPGGEFPVWLLIGASYPVQRQSALVALNQHSPAAPGVIVSSSSHALATHWPRNSRAVLLQDLLEVDGGDVTLQRGLVFDAAPATKRERRGPGAPSKNDTDDVETFLKRVRSGLAKKTSANDEAQSIANWQKDKFGETGARKWTVIRNNISPTWQRWKKAGFPTGVEGTHNLE